MKKITFMLFALLSMIGFAQTETLAEWTPATISASDNYGSSPFDSSTTASNLVVGGLTRGSGIGTTGTPAANAWGGTGFTATSAVEAVAENEFVTFTITADIGYTFSIESIEPYNIRRSTAGPTTGQWQYQLDGGTFTDIGSAITWGSTTSNAGNNQVAIDLIGISDLQDIDADTTVTFRLLLWGASGTGGTWYFNGHNNATNKTLTVLGSVEEESGSTPGYCIPTADTNSSTHGIITNITFNDINNSTTDNADAYQDYTSISTTVEQGGSYALSITTESGGMMFTTWSKAWIDWNNDNVFDSSEEYDLGSGTSVNTTIQIPADALGEYRLRVRTYSQNSMLPFGYVTPCDDTTNSEAEDYTIIVEEESGSTPLTYCEINSDYYDVEEITSVVFGNDTTITNTNDTDILVDFTSTVADVEQGESYTLTVEGNSYGEWENEYVAFIDWNQNGVLDDAGEVYYIGLIYDSTGYDNKTAFTDISVPLTALTGETRIRITKTYTDEFWYIYLNIDPCYISIDDDGWGIEGSFGQALDFTINVLPPNPCTGVTVPTEITVSATEVCEGTSVELGAATATGNTYSWSDGTTEVGTTASITVTPTATTTYTVTVTNSDGCSASEDVVITVTTPVTPIFTPFPSICQGGIITPNAFPTTSNNGITGTWSPAPNNQETTTYTFTPDAEQCAETTTLTITVTPLVVPVFMQVDPIICAGDDLEPLPMVSNQGITGTWSPALDNTQTTAYTFTPDAGQCAASVTMIIVVNVAATPTVESPQTLSEDQTVADIVVTGVTGTLNWYDENGNVVDVSTVLTEGTYMFEVTQTIDGCESYSTDVIVEVTLSTDTFDNASFRAYPNPVKDFFNVSYSKEISTISVINMLGQTVITKNVNATDVQIDMTTLPTGSYFVKVTADGAVKTVKVIR